MDARRHRGPAIGIFIVLVVTVATRPSDHRGSYGDPTPSSYVYICRSPDCGERRRFKSKPRMPGGPRCKECNSKMKREDDDS